MFKSLIQSLINADVPYVAASGNSDGWSDRVDIWPSLLRESLAPDLIVVGGVDVDDGTHAAAIKDARFVKIYAPAENLQIRY